MDRNEPAKARTTHTMNLLPRASTLHGGQPDGAHIADSTLAGRHSYAREQSPPDADYFTRYNYADLAGGF